MKQKTAIILGSTGLTGSHLLQYLLEDKDFQQVISISRKSVGFEHPKLQEELMDLFELKKAEALFRADVVFCAIGTTKAKTPNTEIYEKIDYGIPVEAAKLASENNCPRFIVISAMGANSESRFFYNRLKGKMEEDVLKQKIKHTYILRPSLIVGKRKEIRTMENIGIQVMKIFNFLVPKKYKSIQSETIAKAMWKLSKMDYPKNIILSNEIKEIADSDN